MTTPLDPAALARLRELKEAEGVGMRLSDERIAGIQHDLTSQGERWVGGEKAKLNAMVLYLAELLAEREQLVAIAEAAKRAEKFIADVCEDLNMGRPHSFYALQVARTAWESNDAD